MPRSEQEKAIRRLPPYSAYILYSLANSFQHDPTVIYLSVDVEWYEKGVGRTLEYGWTWSGVLPKSSGQTGWRYASYHYICKERELVTNSIYVPNRKLNFRWGKSKTIMEDEILQEFQRQLNQVAADGWKAIPNEDVVIEKEVGKVLKGDEKIEVDIEDEIDTSSLFYSLAESRRICIVGHDVINDLKHLITRGIRGFDPLTLPPKDRIPHYDSSLDDSQLPNDRVEEECALKSGNSHIAYIFDLKWLWMVRMMDRQEGIKLERLCKELKVDPFCCHNAGNDARYTLHAFYALIKDPPPDYGVPKAATAVKPLTTTKVPKTYRSEDIFDYL